MYAVIKQFLRRNAFQASIYISCCTFECTIKHFRPFPFPTNEMPCCLGCVEGAALHALHVSLLQNFTDNAVAYTAYINNSCATKHAHHLCP